MKITTIFSADTLPQGAVDDDWAKRLFFVGLFGSIFFLIVAFIFAAAAFLIIGRFAFLLILIMFSPVGLVAWITGVSGWGKKWWKTLLDQSFFLPIMLIFWYATVKVMEGMNVLLNGTTMATALSLPGNKDLAASPDQFGGVMGVFVYFFVIATLMIMSIVVARSLGAYGASRAMGAGKMLAGMGLAYTAGAASSRASRLYQRQMAGAQAQDADGKYVDNSRRAQFARRIAGTKLDRYAQKGLGAGASAKFLGAKSLDQRREQDKKERSARLNDLASVGAREGAAGHAATLASGTSTAQDRDTARRSIQGLSISALEELAAKNPNLFNDPNFAQSLSAKQMEALQQSQNVDRGVLTNAQGHRTTAYETSMVPATPAGGGTATTDVRAGRRSTKAMSESELRTLGTSLSDRITRAPGTSPLTTTEVQHIVETLPGAQITNLSDRAIVDPDVYAHLNAAQLTALNNADRLTDAERRTIRTAVMAGGGTASAYNWFNNPTGPGASWV